MEDCMKFTEISENQWNKIKELMNWSPPLERGTQRTDLRRIWNSIFTFFHMDAVSQIYPRVIVMQQKQLPSDG